MTIDMNTITLAFGGHKAREEGICLMEAVAWFAGEQHSDHPVCASPVLGAFGRRLNDILPYDRRQELRDLIPQIVGTAGDGKDEARRWIAVDAAVRQFAPSVLRAAGMDEYADRLAALPGVTAQTADSATTLCREARTAARAAEADAVDTDTANCAGAAAAAASFAYAATDTAAYATDTAAYAGDAADSAITWTAAIETLRRMVTA